MKHCFNSAEHACDEVTIVPSNPFFRIARPGPQGSFKASGCSRYIEAPGYAPDARALIRSYLLLERDLHELFEYIEPCERSRATYSLRTHALLVRACIEVEANATAILAANKFSKPPKKWNMSDAYARLEHSHHLSAYEVRIPDWHGATWTPFRDWRDLRSGAPYQPLSWYRAYNATKHDRANSLQKAQLEHVVDAVCACLVMLTAQFLDYDFTGRPDFLVVDTGTEDGFESSVSPSFSVRLPSSFLEADWYQWDGGDFRKFDFDAVTVPKEK